MNIASRKHNLEHNCNLQESCKSRDVGRYLVYLSEEITALEIALLYLSIAKFAFQSYFYSICFFRINRHAEC